MPSKRIETVAHRGPVLNELQLAPHAGTACDLFDPNVAAAATSTAITTVSARNFMLIASVWERWDTLSLRPTGTPVKKNGPS